MRPRARVRLAALAVAVLALPVLQGAAPAQAVPQAVWYECTTEAFGSSFVDSPQSWSVDLTVPQAVSAGDPLAVTLNSFTAPDGPPIATTGVTLSVSASVEVRKQGGGASVTPSITSAPQGPVDLAPRQPLPATVSGDFAAATGGFATADVLEVLAPTIEFTWLTGDDGMAGAVTTCTPSAPTVLDTASVFSGEDRCIADVTCEASQGLESEILANPDGLAQGQLDNKTDLGTVTTRPYDQTLDGALDSLFVSDVRGNDIGWTQSAFMATDFVGTDPTFTIPAERLSIAPSCTPTALDIDGLPVALPLPGSVCTPGSPATFGGTGPGEAVTIASAPDVPTGTGGIWKVDADVELEVPAYQAASTYKATITIVLTSN